MRVLDNRRRLAWWLWALALALAFGPTRRSTANETSAALLERARHATQPFLEQVKVLVNIDSKTGYATGLADVEKQVVALLEKESAKIETSPASVGVGNTVVATWTGQGRARILLLAHSDTVFKEGTAAQRPFRIDGNRAYGPGVMDDKGGILMALNAVRLLREEGFDDYARITLLINPDEETGSFGSRDLVRKLASDHDAALVMEFGSPEDKVTNWRKGIAYFKIEIKGRKAHAGAEPEKGCNAAMELSHQVLQLSKLGNPVKETNLIFTIIQAGDVDTKNMIPDLATGWADVRVRYPEEFDRLERETQRVAQNKLLTCAQVSTVLKRGRPPFLSNPKTDALVKKAVAIYREIGLDLGVEGSGGGTDGNYTALVGTPTLDALGPVGGGAHGDDEYIDIDKIAPRIYLLVRLMMDISAGQ